MPDFPTLKRYTSADGPIPVTKTMAVLPVELADKIADMLSGAAERDVNGLCYIVGIVMQNLPKNRPVAPLSAIFGRHDSATFLRLEIDPSGSLRFYTAHRKSEVLRNSFADRKRAGQMPFMTVADMVSREAWARIEKFERDAAAFEAGATHPEHGSTQ